MYQYYWQITTFIEYSDEYVPYYCEITAELVDVPLRVLIQNTFDEYCWLLIFSLFPLSFLVLLYPTINSIPKKIESIFISMVALLLNQSVPNRGKKILYLAVIMMGFVLTTHYSTYITSEIIAPPEKIIFSDFKELVENSYQLLKIKDMRHKMAVNDYTHLFEKYKMLDRMNSSIYIFDWEIEKPENANTHITHEQERLRLLTNYSMKLFSLFAKSNAQYVATLTKLYSLEGECMSTEVPALTESYSYAFAHLYRHNFQAYFQRMQEKGFLSIWKKQDDLYLKEKRLLSEMKLEETEAVNINLKMKIHTIFIFCGYIFLGSVVTLMLELLWDETSPSFSLEITFASFVTLVEQSIKKIKHPGQILRSLFQLITTQYRRMSQRKWKIFRRNKVSVQNVNHSNNIIRVHNV